MNGIKLILLILLSLCTGCSLTGELVVSAEHKGMKAEYRVCGK